MELQFTFILGLTLFCLLVTFLILLKGTRNFIYRTAGLVCFAFLIFSISYGYMNLIGKPKPLTYETWPTKQSEVKDKSKGKGGKKGEEEQEGQSTLTMDVLKWENNGKKREAYLWMREENQRDKKPEYYSFSTNTEDGKELLKQLQQAEQAARRRGLRGRNRGTGVKLRVIIDRLLMSPRERFKFYTPPAKMLPPKPIQPPGIRYPTTTNPTNTNRNQQFPGGRNVTPRVVQPSVVQPSVVQPTVVRPRRRGRH